VPRAGLGGFGSFLSLLSKPAQANRMSPVVSANLRQSNHNSAVCDLLTLIPYIDEPDGMRRGVCPPVFTLIA
jgi:hypothetical protein